MLVTELGIVTEVKLVHSRKAEFPMLVTELGIVIVAILLSINFPSVVVSPASISAIFAGSASRSAPDGTPTPFASMAETMAFFAD